MESYWHLLPSLVLQTRILSVSVSSLRLRLFQSRAWSHHWDSDIFSFGLVIRTHIFPVSVSSLRLRPFQSRSRSRNWDPCIFSLGLGFDDPSLVSLIPVHNCIMLMKKTSAGKDILYLQENNWGGDTTQHWKKNLPGCSGLVFILQAGTCQILSLAENARWSPSVAIISWQIVTTDVGSSGWGYSYIHSYVSQVSEILLLFDYNIWKHNILLFSSNYWQNA